MEATTHYPEIFDLAKELGYGFLMPWYEESKSNKYTWEKPLQWKEHPRKHIEEAYLELSRMNIWLINKHQRGMSIIIEDSRNWELEFLEMLQEIKKSKRCQT